ncbi:MAG: adenylyl-sulfate kinase, partial [Burkholderiaceae bacterium]|nr:adenylyl-sulfate kinase [Burkholderiaceae bacterium]
MDSKANKNSGEVGKTAIQVVERMMNLLDCLADQEEASSLKLLSQKTELHPSTAHRILNDMVACRLVERGDGGTYRLGLRLLELGNLVKERLSVREAAQLPMRALHKLTGETVNLSVRQGDEIVYVDRAYSERSGMQVVRAIGGRAPLHLTSVGIYSYVLDADNVRHGLNADLGFSDDDRRENVRRMGHVAQLFADAGAVVIVPIISPFQESRDAVR